MCRPKEDERTNGRGSGWTESDDDVEANAHKWRGAYVNEPKARSQQTKSSVGVRQSVSQVAGGASLSLGWSSDGNQNKLVSCKNLLKASNLIREKIRIQFLLQICEWTLLLSATKFLIFMWVKDSPAERCQIFVTSGGKPINWIISDSIKWSCVWFLQLSPTSCSMHLPWRSLLGLPSRTINCKWAWTRIVLNTPWASDWCRCQIL